jgi:hypothetical protein
VLRAGPLSVPPLEVLRHEGTALREELINVPISLLHRIENLIDVIERNGLVPKV